MMRLSKQDFAIGAIDRLAVRRGISRDVAESLLQTRAGLTAREAKCLAGHWFSQQFSHGGVTHRRAEYLARAILAAESDRKASAA